MDLADVTDPIEKYETMSRCAREAEQAGYDAIWVYDHFHTVPEPRLESVFECWTSMAALARDTRTIRLGRVPSTRPGPCRPPILERHGAGGCEIPANRRTSEPASGSAPSRVRDGLSPSRQD